MRTIRVIGLALAGALAILATAAPVGAQSWDRRTFFEFSGPVSVPGVTLPAGRYIFRVADTTQRDVLQVLSADGRTSYAQFFALRAQRMEASSLPELRFMETGPGVPAAVRTWWHPFERGGYEFIYPKDQARKLAEGVRQPVLAAVSPGETALITPEGTTEPAIEPAPYYPQLPAVIGEEAPQTIPVAEPRTELPKTASDAPFILMLGLALLLGSALLAGIRVFRW